MFPSGVIASATRVRAVAVCLLALLCVPAALAQTEPTKASAPASPQGLSEGVVVTVNDEMIDL